MGPKGCTLSALGVHTVHPVHPDPAGRGNSRWRLELSGLKSYREFPVAAHSISCSSLLRQSLNSSPSTVEKVA